MCAEDALCSAATFSSPHVVQGCQRRSLPSSVVSFSYSCSHAVYTVRGTSCVVHSLQPSPHCQGCTVSNDWNRKGIDQEVVKVQGERLWVHGSQSMDLEIRERVGSYVHMCCMGARSADMHTPSSSSDRQDCLSTCKVAHTPDIFVWWRWWLSGSGGPAVVVVSVRQW